MTSFRVERFETPDGLTLVADVGGPEGAPSVVLLHGGGQTRHSWAGTMGQLVDQGYRVINVDARGHGDSDWAPDGEYRFTTQAGDLMAILAKVGRPVALVGASMGGATSFYAVGSHAEPIADALVLVDIVPRPAEGGARRIHAFMNANPDGFASVEEAADAVSAYYPERPRPKDVSGLRKNLRLRDGRYYWHWDPRILEMTQQAEPPHFSDELIRVAPCVTLPTLLVRGGKSDVVDDAGVAEMLRLVPHTEIFDVAGAGHMVAGDRNDPFSAGMIAFLGRHIPPR
ncbi:alpha/beta fold hydrolase [Rhizorhabdus dicambivorans]|uniref:Alpha/beta hydrolase n=1 Tax=Rhizorhabdus dicambivorans TaxID=1850238 RepID=A0A2A4FT12_9SPHN|nr:alpha/beta hydrolase [Rhizorhabdus dicambivorans]ATE65448.1 alpha/beta hydrolase [Rhizorhabdus dicambivorans]PCE40588.1 alpha/beta hydrolase [Rhizorhabdus dicambivorans]